MQQLNPSLIFDNTVDFKQKALEVFRFQAKNVAVYKKYIELLKIDAEKVNSIAEIPFLPIEMFKQHRITTGKAEEKVLFTSSGTTGMQTSKHFVQNADIYIRSFTKAFGLFYGKPEQYIIFALLPGYLERSGSSLIYMVKNLIAKSGNAASGFYLNNYKELQQQINSLKNSNKKLMLIGVSFALLDMAEQFPVEAKDMIVMETGGMKGRRKELVREELHAILKQGFGVSSIHSEYGMTELLSQAYSKGEGRFHTPDWMQILIRDMHDPFHYLDNSETGGINVIDLANLYSCSFIETRDLGKLYSDGSFEVLGRFDNSDIRGCNLMVS